MIERSRMKVYKRFDSACGFTPSKSTTPPCNVHLVKHVESPLLVQEWCRAKKPLWVNLLVDCTVNGMHESAHLGLSKHLESDQKLSNPRTPQKRRCKVKVQMSNTFVSFLRSQGWQWHLMQSHGIREGSPASLRSSTDAHSCVRSFMHSLE